MNGAVIPIMAFYIVAAEEQGVPQAALEGTIQNDILKEFMVRNTYIYPPAPSMRIVSDIFAYCAENMPKFNSISISGYHMHEAGATAVQELAFTIADGIAYVREGVRSGLGIDDFAPRLSFFFGIGMNLFMEVAKLRAARLLWHRAMTTLGARDARSTMLRTHCQTSGVSLTEQDPYNNVVRTTVEALAAVLGGTQSLHTNSFDEALALPTDFSARIARNTQIILAEETGIRHVVDPLGGSYYVEALTAELADAAQTLIDRVEAEGGMTKAVVAGWPKAMIEEAAAARQARVDRGEDTIVGVNKYRLENEAPVEILEVDNEAVRAGQVKRLADVRAARDEGKVRAALEALKEAALRDPFVSSEVETREAPAVLDFARTERGALEGNLLALAVEAARVRATLGEISAAMEDVFGRHETLPEPVSGIYAAPYAGDARWTRITEGVEAVTRRLGRPPRILVAKMGQDGHDRGANLIASAFGDLGFEVIPGPLFQTTAETAVMAIVRGVDIVGVSSLAGGHKTLIPDLIAQLRERGGADIKVIAGGVIPPQDYEVLRDAGVQGIYGPGSNVLDAAADVLRLLGHNLPPAGEVT
jgi:methylmalonyl-CoA mutase